APRPADRSPSRSGCTRKASRILSVVDGRCAIPDGVDQQGARRRLERSHGARPNLSPLRQPLVQLDASTGHDCSGEPGLELGPAGPAVEAMYLVHGTHQLLIGLAQKAGDALANDLGHRAPSARNDWDPAREGLDQDEAERLGPVDWEEQGERTAQQ